MRPVVPATQSGPRNILRPRPRGSVGHVCERVTRLLEAQVVDDASRARSRARRKHTAHCFITLELSQNKSFSDSIFPAVQNPACCHSLLAAVCISTISYTPNSASRVPSAWPSSPPQSPHCRQQFSDICVTVEQIFGVLIFISRYCDSSHYQTPNVHLRAFTSWMWRQVECRGFSCSLGRCRRHELSFRSYHRQHNRCGHNKNICTHHSLRLTSGTGLILSLIIHVLRNSTRSLCR